MKSIRRRLLVFLLPALLLLFALAAAASYLQARHEVSEVFDYHLREIAESLREHSSLAVDDFNHRDRKRAEIILQISELSPGGRVSIHGNPRLPSSAEVGFRNVIIGGRELRIFGLLTPTRLIQVAQPMEVRRHVGVEVASVTVIPVAVALPMAALIVWFAVGRGLAPVNRLAAEVSARTASTLSPLPTGPLPAEVVPLVLGLNGLLDRLSRALDTQRAFVADAAHELRSPMTALRLQLRLLEEESVTGPPRAATVERLREGVERGIRMVEQLLSLARLDPGVQLPKTEVDLLAAAKEAVVAESIFAERKEIDLGVVTSMPATVRADHASIHAMLHNLIDNAVRYTPPGGRVDVAVRREGSAAVVEVIDSGPGIPAEQRARVFDRFFRGDQASGSGSGLGLAIVKRIVETLGGSIALNSPELGTGLRVSVRLPLEAP